MSFYCKGTGDGTAFYIDKWNEEFKASCLANKEVEEKVCTEQCFECMAEVGERRKKTNELKSKS